MSRTQMLRLSTAGFVVLYGAATIVGGTRPSIDDSGATVAHWFEAHRRAVQTSSVLLTLVAAVLVGFAVLLAERLGRGRAPFLVGVAAIAVLSSAQAWLYLGLAQRPAQLSPDLARLVMDISIYWGPMLIGFTLLTLAPIAWAGLRAGTLPEWVGWVAAIAFVEQALEVSTMFGASGFFAPDGALGTYIGPAVTVLAWVFAGATARLD